MRVGSLFAGIGGFDLGMERAGFTIAWQVENDPYCQRVLAKHWPNVKRYGDITTIDWGAVEPVDVICGGFPCQDISIAGKGAGLAGARSGLWREYAKAIQALKPKWVIIENVSAIRLRGLEQVLQDLSTSGYDAEWERIQAADIGADHERERVWIVGYPHDGGQSTGAKHDEASGVRRIRPAADAERRVKPQRLHLASAWREQQSLPWNRVWPDQDSPLGMGVHDGIPARLDRLAALGNAVVPQIVELIGNAILEAA